MLTAQYQNRGTCERLLVKGELCLGVEANDIDSCISALRQRVPQGPNSTELCLLNRASRSPEGCGRQWCRRMFTPNYCGIGYAHSASNDCAKILWILDFV
jgi:hypothetical protein